MEWSRPLYFCPVVSSIFLLLSFFFYPSPYLSDQSQSGRLPYFHTWCGLSANLKHRSEICRKRLAEKYRTQKIAKICRLCSIAHTCRAVSSQLRHVSTIRKELVKQQYLFHMSSQYGELRLTGGWDRFGSFGHPSKFQRVSRLVFVTAATSFTGGQPNFARYLAVCRAATLYVHRVAKIVQPLGCYNFETYDRILIFFWQKCY